MDAAVTEASRVLVAHDCWDIGVIDANVGIHCECGWRGATVDARAAHQAEALAAAGLLRSS